MGPTTKAISVTGGITFAELRDGYNKQAKGLIDGGAASCWWKLPGHAQRQGGAVGHRIARQGYGVRIR